MSAAAPWSVKGIDPKTREVAKDLARRSGMTLGEWLSYMIADSDEDDGYTPLARRTHAEDAHERRRRARRLDDAYGMDTSASALAAIEALSARIEGAERRSALAIDGVDRAVAGLVRRLEETDTANATRDRRIDELSEAMREGRGRLRRFEDEVGPRQAEAFGKIEEAIGKLAGRFYEAEARGRDAQTTLRDRMDRFERESSPERLAEAVVERVSARLGDAQNRTAEAMRRLEGSFADLDRRIGSVERNGGQGGALEKLAESLSRKVEESRAEMLRRLDGAVHDGRMDRVERAVADLGQHVQESERRSAQALEAMGREVVRIAENLNGRLEQTERKQADILTESQERALKAVETMGQELSKSLGSDMARVADAIEHRLRRADDQHALALEKLGGEITRISERLAERIAQGERRAAQGVDDLAEKLNRASEKMESRYDRASGELAERMRQSEERTAKLLAEARESIDKQLAKREPAGTDWREQAFPQETFDSDWREPAADFPAAETLDPGFPAAQEAFADPVFEEPAPSFGERAGFGQVAHEAVEPTFEAEEDLAQLEPAPQVAAAPQVPVMPVFGASEPPAQAFVQPAADLDSFEAEDEFVTDRRPRGERPLTTREAIEAARAATRLGDDASEDGETKKGFGFRLGGKSRLQKRMDKQSKRESSTIRKALGATTTAVLVVGVGAAGVLGYQRLVEEGSAIPGLTGTGSAELLAASAVAPTTPTITPPPSEAQAEAQALYDEATPLIEAGDAEGVRLLSRAANLGHPQAQFALARLYETGEAGVTADPAEARRWTERAARGGEVRAMHNLGLYLFEGLGGMRDQTEAARWFRAAAERGLVDSQYNLARLFERGAEGVDPNPVEAYQWYLIASRAGDTGAEAGAARLRADLPASRRLDAEAAADRFEAQTVQTG